MKTDLKHIIKDRSVVDVRGVRCEWWCEQDTEE